MRARPGSRACRRARTATCRRSTTTASIGSRPRIRDLPVVLNGGIASLEQAAEHLERLDGVMMGRAAYQEPWRLLDGRSRCCSARPRRSRRPRRPPRRSSPISSASLRAARGSTPSRATCSACSAACRARAPSAGIWRREAVKPGAGADVLAEALALVAGHRRRDCGAHRGGVIRRSSSRKPGHDASVSRSASCSGSPLAIVVGGVVTGILAGLFGIGGGAHHRAGPLRGLPRARRAGGGAHAALRRHLDRDHRADQHPLLPDPSRARAR